METILILNQIKFSRILLLIWHATLQIEGHLKLRLRVPLEPYILSSRDLILWILSRSLNYIFKLSLSFIRIWVGDLGFEPASSATSPTHKMIKCCLRFLWLRAWWSPLLLVNVPLDVRPGYSLRHDDPDQLVCSWEGYLHR